MILRTSNFTIKKHDTFYFFDEQFGYIYLCVQERFVLHSSNEHAHNKTVLNILNKLIKKENANSIDELFKSVYGYNTIGRPFPEYRKYDYNAASKYIKLLKKYYVVKKSR